MRTRKSREHWLVDVSSLAANLTEEELRLVFEDLSLDLDDDLYLYNGKFLYNEIDTAGCS